METSFLSAAAFFQALCVHILIDEFGYEESEVFALAHAPAVELRDECGEEGFDLWQRARVKANIA